LSADVTQNISTAENQNVSGYYFDGDLFKYKMNKTKSFIILAVAILLGMSIQWVDPFFSILLVFTWGMAFICSVIALLSGIFSKRFRIWYLLGFVPFVSGYLFMTGIRDYRHRKAVDIVGRINMYAKERGRLPEFNPSNRYQNFRFEILYRYFT